MNPSTINPTTLTRPPAPTAADIVGPVERIVLDAQGACKNSLDSGWKLGRLLLTDERFIFVAGRRIVTEVPLDTVIEVSTEKRAFVLASTATVRLSWGKQAARLPRRLWLVTKKIEAWRDALFQATVLEVTGQVIERVASAVDDDSAALLRYIWSQHHAGVDELVELIDAPGHDYVLERIRESISPAAVRLLGCNILVFRCSCKTSDNSEPITNHWWIAGKRKPVSATPAVQVSVFDGPDHVDVVADLPGVRDGDVLLNIFDNRLIISAASDTQQFNEETAIPTGARAETMTWRINNGVLVVRFRRLSHGDRAQTPHELTLERTREGE